MVIQGTPNPVLAHGLDAVRYCAHGCACASPIATATRPRLLPIIPIAVANTSANLGAIYPLPKCCAEIASALQ